MAAQGGHALSRMKMRRLIEDMRSKRHPRTFERLEALADEKITTIWKSCRDSRELEHIHRLLAKARIKHCDFEDENDEVYGTYDDGAGCHPRTALATVPVYPEQVIDIADYLPLWKPKGDD
jgi:hypothetical protein